jgi:hypothetical protein
MARSTSDRAKVIGWGFAIGAAMSGLAVLGGAAKMDWGLLIAAEVWASVLAGPFAGLWATSD